MSFTGGPVKQPKAKPWQVMGAPSPASYRRAVQRHGVPLYPSRGSRKQTSRVNTDYGNYGGGGGYDSAKAEAENRMRRRIRIGEKGIKSAGKGRVNRLVNTYDDKTRNFLRNFGESQRNINTGQTNNALNLRRSLASTASDVRQGLRSGEVDLGNMNALDSGAAEAMSRAWARVGGRQTNEARNEAALQTRELDADQVALNQERDDTVRSLHNFYQAEKQAINADLENRLDNLWVQADEQGLGAEVHRGLRNQLLNQAIRRIRRLEEYRKNRMKDIYAFTPEQILQEAAKMDTAGVGANPFDVGEIEVDRPGEVATDPTLPGVPGDDDDDPLVNTINLDEDLADDPFLTAGG